MESLCALSSIFNQTTQNLLATPNGKQTEIDPKINITVTIDKINLFNPVITLQRNDKAPTIENESDGKNKTEWKYSIYLQYENQQQYGLWTVKQK